MNSASTGKYSTNFKAEAEALKTAATETKNNLPRAYQKFVILTDALSILHALKNPHRKDLNELTTVLSELSSRVDLILHWIPAYCGIYGNEKTGRLAKKGGLLGQRDRQVSFNDEKTIIKTLTEKKKKKFTTFVQFVADK